MDLQTEKVSCLLTTVEGKHAASPQAIWISKPIIMFLWQLLVITNEKNKTGRTERNCTGCLNGFERYQIV